MNKLFNLSIAVILSALILSCGGAGDRAKTGEAENVTVTEGDHTFKVDSTNSNIYWVGTKPTGKHNGTIQISEGEILIADNSVVGGNFTIDMSTIENHDLTDPEKNANLVGHLKSADFFEVESYPISRFVITSTQSIDNNVDFNYNITGNLTMKDSTASITFPAKVTLNDNKISVVSAEFAIDRSIWNVRYGSRKFFDNLRDDYIGDDITLQVNINAEESS